MSSVAEIEQAISRLPREDFFRLVSKLRLRYGTEWDCQIEEDARAGRLDGLWSQAEQEISEGKARPLDELLHD